MAHRYYYLIAYLPHLKFGEPISISSKDFLAECGKWLSEGDMGQIAALDMDDLDTSVSDPEVIREYKGFLHNQRQQLASVRESRKHAGHPKLQEPLDKVFGADNPLRMERILERLRWDFVEDLEADYDFDMRFLAAYFIKLQINERLNRFDEQKATGIFDSLCEVVYE